jgi:hypothetical protein
LPPLPLFCQNNLLLLDAQLDILAQPPLLGQPALKRFLCALNDLCLSQLLGQLTLNLCN